MKSERELWDDKYKEGSHTSARPDPLLLSAYEEFVQPLFPNGGRVLDLAGGVGRHAIWLAQRGWDATIIDVSEIGLARAQKNALEQGVTVKCELADLKSYNLGQNQCDLILNFFYLQRDLFPALISALRPGGLLIYKTYTTEQPKLDPGGGPTHPMHLLQANELLHAFSSMQVLFYRETVKDRGTAELVARKRS